MRNHFFLWAILFSTTSLADINSDNNSSEQLQQCIQTTVTRADESMSIKELKDACFILIQQAQHTDTIENEAVNTTIEKPTTNFQALPSDTATTNSPAKLESKPVSPKNESKTKTTASPTNILQERLTIEALNRSNRFILTPHKRNFLLPVSYTDKPNTEPYSDTDTDTTLTDLKHTEAELQLSVKILIRENIFDKNGHLYLGYTNHSLWQVYNRRLSAPFRATDHQPELILSFTNDWEIFGFRNAVNEVIINHQSNGQTGLLSRSWNRIMLSTVFEKGNFAVTFNPWYRLPEKSQEYPGDPRGDDNPEISKYMGNFELSGAYKYESDIFSVRVRHNLQSENYGAIELGWTFPVTKTMRGFVSYFNGYGHSLIEYNTEQQVFGLGIIFTDLF